MSGAPGALSKRHQMTARSSLVGETKSCCAPQRSHCRDHTERKREPTASREQEGSTNGMRLISGGNFLMGSETEPPVHQVEVAPFYADATCVTNEQFNEFVNATRYETEAERFGWGFVFVGHLSSAEQAKFVRGRVLGSEWWCRVEGATWRHPEGPGSNIVVQVSWNDADACAKWAGKRLPTEAEWEFAARAGLVQKPFPWGDDLEPGGKHMMNVWQGLFPTLNTEADGYYGTAPVKSFKPNGYGLYNMTGNVWEWCSDWFGSDYYRASPHLNPRGPAEGDRRVMRGGSYLCHHSYCNRYRTDARYGNTPDSATTNCGFRCVKSF
jgi:sulfatase modifying factor 1